ncbi:MAG TPA: hypothetical protein DCQ31_15095 [Bacteroidales bacterium]|nr:hypothetical protein [Bacteroidales bacterium]
MKRILLLLVLMASTVFVTNAQETETPKPAFSYMWINPGVGASAVVSTNIVNSGAVFTSYLEFLVQEKRRRIGIGMAHELYLTPEALAKLVFGNSSNTEKVYLTWEYMLFPNFPLNIGAHAQIGGFLVGNEIKEANKDTVNVPDYNYFGNVGLLVELGWKPVYFFVKPAIEYKSYSGLHKEILAGATFGFKFKLSGDDKKKPKK